MIKHNLLNRQLKRLGLNEKQIPTEQQWHDFLNRIDRTYLDTDQERYLLERSTDISSKEMRELNERLESAHRIAHIGYWQREVDTSKILWSKEIYSLLGLNPNERITHFKSLLDLAHPDDLPAWMQKIKNTIEKCEKYHHEIRIKHANGEYRWFEIVGYPHAPQSPGGSVKMMSGTIMDITDRKKIEVEMEALNQQLLMSARKAGMAEVSASILHNVGNVLNSVNVSTNIIFENLRKSRANKLNDLATLILENLQNIGDYFHQDPKGKLIPAYFQQLADIINEENHINQEEIRYLNKSIEHIKNIIAMQQNSCGLSGIKEHISINDLVDDAIKISGESIEKREILIIREFSELPKVCIEKAKLMQIIVNFIQNAKDALVNHETPEQKKIIIKTCLSGDNKIQITVTDNGLGISTEDLKRIFTFGFTTKKDGHGFGLHSSAIIAKELGGSIHASSNGHGNGATFTLILPYKLEYIEGKNYEKIT